MMPNIIMADVPQSGLPFSTITFSTNITNGENLKSAIEGMTGITPGSLIIIKKPKSQWEEYQFVFGLYDFSGTLSAGYRYRVREISTPTNLSSIYDFKASAGDEYYVVSIPPM